MKQVIRIVFKILAIIIFIRSLNYIAPIIQGVIYRKEEVGIVQFSIIPVLIVMSILIILSLSLWFYNKQITNVLFKDNDKSINISVDLGGLQTVSFCVVGIYIVITSFPALIDEMIKIFINKNLVSANTKIFIQSEIILHSIKLILGLFLIFGAKRIAYFLKKIRTASFYNYEDESIDINKDKN